ncbi:MAG TPA: hypothetical protein VFX21_05320, partial [Acidimicrobiia bacterium]|nr:hypothetical protein [Acidimicrobiia bacterium]
MSVPAPVAVPSSRAPRPRSRFVAILLYTFRSCFPRRRYFALLFPCAGAVLFGLLALALDERTAERAFATVAADGIFGLVVPIAAL